METEKSSQNILVLNTGINFGWPRFGRRSRVNLLLWVFIIMTEIKDQAIIVQDLFGCHKKIPSGEKFRMFSASRVCLIIDHFAQMAKKLSVIRIAAVASEKYSQ